MRRALAAVAALSVIAALAACSSGPPDADAISPEERAARLDEDTADLYANTGALVGRKVTVEKLPCGPIAASAPPDENGIELLADFPTHRGNSRLMLWDGHLAYVRNYHAAVVCDLATGKAEVVSGPTYLEQQVRWVRGSGTTAVYDTVGAESEGPGELDGAPWAFWRYDLVTGRRDRIAHGSSGYPHGLFPPTVDDGFVVWTQDRDPHPNTDQTVGRNQLMSYELATGTLRVLDPDVDGRSVLSLTGGMVYFEDRRPPETGPLILYRVPADGSGPTQAVPGPGNVSKPQVRDGLATWLSVDPDYAHPADEPRPYVYPVMAVRWPDPPVQLGYGGSLTLSSGRFVAWSGPEGKDRFKGRDTLWVSEPGDPTHPIPVTGYFAEVGFPEWFSADGDLLAWSYVANWDRSGDDRHIRISRIPLPRG